MGGGGGKLVLWTAVMAVGVAWNIYNIASATEAPNQAVAIMSYFALAGMTIGLVGGLIGLAGSAVKIHVREVRQTRAARCGTSGPQQRPRERRRA